LQDYADIIEFGRDLDERITRLQRHPVERAGEKIELFTACREFVAMSKKAEQGCTSQLIGDGNAGLSLGQLQELLRLVSRIGRALTSGMFEI